MNEKDMATSTQEVEKQVTPNAPPASQPERPPEYPSHRKVVLIGLLIVVVLVAGFVAGWLPRTRTTMEVNAESKQETARLPIVTVMPAKRAAAEGEIVLPANIQAVTDAPILARADGYVAKRFVDIGDRVKAGQVLATIEAPELDQQVQQAQANVLQAQAAIEQARATEEQAKVQQQLAQVTAQRYGGLLARGAVSKQENDQYQTQYLAQSTQVQALNRGVAAAQQSLAAARANLSRLEQVQSYKQVRAPFAGVITLRNIDTGALISTGQTLMFRVAQTDRLRAYINVPQSDAENIKVGQTASLHVSDFDQEIQGRIVRTANAIDPSSRTLLAEVEVGNSNGKLMPGAYGQVVIRNRNVNPPLVIPGGTLVIGPKGTQVAVVGKDGRVIIKNVVVGRDLGQTVEITAGLNEGDLCINNPNDDVRSGVQVDPHRPVKGE